jgi:hypothetical protein
MATNRDGFLLTAPTISTWALIAGLGAGGVTILLSRTTNIIPADTPRPVVWLGAWATLLVLQAGWWALTRKRKQNGSA